MIQECCKDFVLIEFGIEIFLCGIVQSLMARQKRAVVFHTIIHIILKLPTECQFIKGIQEMMPEFRYYKNFTI